MFIIVNRHNEVLYNDGVFYPAYSTVVRRMPLFFDTKEEAEQHRLTIKEYTRAIAREDFVP